MTDQTAPLTAQDAVATRRILDFARSEMFDRTFHEGMALVEETASYLDGPGRAASKQLDRIGALAYAGESMRMTTRLMQVASWLLVQRAVRDGEMSLAEASSSKYRFVERDRSEEHRLQGEDALPAPLKGLMARCEALYARVRRIDATMYLNAAPEEDLGEVKSQWQRLHAAFGQG